MEQTAIGGEVRLGQNTNIGIDHVEAIHGTEQCPTIIKTENPRKMQAAALCAALALKGNTHRCTFTAYKVNVQYIVPVIVSKVSCIYIIPAWTFLQEAPEAVPGKAQVAQLRMIGVGSGKVDALPLAG